MNNNDFLLDIGKRIIERRKQMGLSQEEFAELAGVTPQMLSTAERGIKALRPENLLKISKTLGVSVDYLLTGEVIDKDVDDVYKKLSSVSPKQFRTIERIIDNCIYLCDDQGI